MKKVLALLISVMLIVAGATVAAADLPASLQGGGIGNLTTANNPTGTKVLNKFAKESYEDWFGDDRLEYCDKTKTHDSGTYSAKIPTTAIFALSGLTDTTWNSFTDADPATGQIAVDSTYYLSFWIYPAANTSLAGSAPFLTLSSNDTGTNNPDLNNLQYWFKEDAVYPANTWSNVVVPLTLGDRKNLVDVAKSNGTFDPQKINYIRFMNNTGVTINVDDISFSKVPATQATDWDIAYPSGTVQLFDNCDSAKADGAMTWHNTPTGGTWNGGRTLFGMTNPFSTDGTGSYLIYAGGDSAIQEFWGSGQPAITLPNSRKQYLAFDMYIQNVAKISTDTEKATWYGKVIVDLAYGLGGMSGNGMKWEINPSALHNGWNRIILPLNFTSEAAVDLTYAIVTRNGTGPVDANGDFAVNQFRIGLDTTTGTYMAVDNINLIYTPGVTPEEITTAPTASDITDGSMKLTWTAPTTATGIGGYVITRELYDPLMEEWIADGDAVKVSGASTLSTTISGLEAETQYRFTVKAVEDLNESPLVILATYALSGEFKTLEASEDPGTSSGGGSSSTGGNESSTGGNSTGGNNNTNGDDNNGGVQAGGSGGVLALCALIVMTSAAAIVIFKKQKSII